MQGEHPDSDVVEAMTANREEFDRRVEAVLVALGGESDSESSSDEVTVALDGYYGEDETRWREIT